MLITDKARDVLHLLEELFKNPEQLVDTMAQSYIKGEGRPIDRWSWCNRLICWVNKTSDARTFKQWKDAGRSIKRGSKAFGILAPNLYKVKAEEEDEEDKMVLKGFRSFPVFGYEQTEGDPLPTFEPPKAPPLLDVAGKWGIEVTYQPQMIKHCGGWYSPSDKEIILLTHDDSVFFHELMHVADDKASDGLKAGQQADQEIVAETGAAVLARMYGFKTDAQSYKYLKAYNDNPLTALHTLLPRIEKALDTIFEAAETCENAKDGI